MEQGSGPGQNTYLTYENVFTNAKAGMECISTAQREHIKKTIFNMSKDSAHFHNEQRKQAQVEARITVLKERASRLTDAELAAQDRAMKQKMAVLEASRDLTRIWVHVDMDAFFASCEELANPSLKEVPLAVGGIGMISTANYLARKFGVRSAMPGFIGKVLCPQLVFVPTNFERYTEFSQKTRDIFTDFDAQFEAGSLDEACLDITDYCSQAGLSGAQVAEELRRRVREETRLTCSCGVAPNKMLAKICSDLHKPDGQFVLSSNRQAVVSFIETLPVRKIPGVGRVTEQMLGSFGVHMCGDMVKKLPLLAAILTPALLEFTLAAGMGLGETRHTPPVPDNEPHRKGISCERTFKAMSSKQELESMASFLVEHLCGDMATENIEGKTLTLKLKAASFEVYTRAATLPRHASSPEQLLPTAIKLLHAELPISARLMGFRMSNLRKKGLKPESSAFTRFFQAQQQQHPQQPQQQPTGVSVPEPAEPLAAPAVDQHGTEGLLCATSGHEVLAGTSWPYGSSSFRDEAALCDRRPPESADVWRDPLLGPDDSLDAFCEGDWQPGACASYKPETSIPPFEGEHANMGHTNGPHIQDNGGFRRFEDPPTAGSAWSLADQRYRDEQVQDASRPIQHQQQEPAASKPSSNLWACRACTFAGNKTCILRCSVCDTLKGMEVTESSAASHRRGTWGCSLPAATKRAGTSKGIKAKPNAVNQIFKSVTSKQ